MAAAVMGYFVNIKFVIYNFQDFSWSLKYIKKKKLESSNTSFSKKLKKKIEKTFK